MTAAELAAVREAIPEAIVRLAADSEPDEDGRLGEDVQAEIDRLVAALDDDEAAVDVLRDVLEEADDIRLATRAPAGYSRDHPLTIGGKSFVGGEFIPGDVLAKASPEERAELEGTHRTNVQPRFLDSVLDAPAELRDRRGRKIGADELAEARADPDVADELADRLAPEMQPLLERLLQEQPKPKQGSTSLGSGAVTYREPLQGGINHSFIVHLEDGSKAVWKPAKGEGANVKSGKRQFRKGVPEGEQYKREAAAYAIAEAIGMADLVPTTVLREIDGEVGSAQAYADLAKPAKLERNLAKRFDGDADLARAAAFDYLIGNMDRHAGNWMIDVETSRLVLIDHGFAFPTAYEREDWQNLDIMYRSVRKNLAVPSEAADWDWAKIEAGLKKCELGEDAIALTKQRFEAVTAAAGKPIESLPSLIRPYPDFGFMVARQQANKASI